MCRKESDAKDGETPMERRNWAGRGGRIGMQLRIRINLRGRSGGEKKIACECAAFVFRANLSESRRLDEYAGEGMVIVAGGCMMVRWATWIRRRMTTVSSGGIVRLRGTKGQRAGHRTERGAEESHDEYDDGKARR